MSDRITATPGDDDDSFQRRGADPLRAGQKREAMRAGHPRGRSHGHVSAAEKLQSRQARFSNGAILGKSFIKYKAGGGKVTPIPIQRSRQWFVDEELARPTKPGHVFFVHFKILLIDPLSDDPLVCSGSANFSKNSLVANDENMLLIRGDRRVADITSRARPIFRHFRARDIINETATAGQRQKWLELVTER